MQKGKRIRWAKLTSEEVVAAIKSRCIIDANGCWLWQGAGDGGGYGQARINGKNRHVHRVTYEYTYLVAAMLPEEVYVCHKCDVRQCCNPDHLFAGSATANNHDCIAKGRARKARGEKASAAKLTTDQILEIRRLYAAGNETHRSLATRFGVCHAVIGCAIRRKTWKHV